MAKELKRVEKIGKNPFKQSPAAIMLKMHGVPDRTIDEMNAAVIVHAIATTKLAAEKGAVGLGISQMLGEGRATPKKLEAGAALVRKLAKREYEDSNNLVWEMAQKELKSRGVTETRETFEIKAGIIAELRKNSGWTTKDFENVKIDLDEFIGRIIQLKLTHPSLAEPTNAMPLLHLPNEERIEICENSERVSSQVKPTEFATLALKGIPAKTIADAIQQGISLSNVQKAHELVQRGHGLPTIAAYFKENIRNPERVTLAEKFAAAIPNLAERIAFVKKNATKAEELAQKGQTPEEILATFKEQEKTPIPKQQKPEATPEKQTLPATKEKPSPSILEQIQEINGAHEHGFNPNTIHQLAKTAEHYGFEPHHVIALELVKGPKKMSDVLAAFTTAARKGTEPDLVRKARDMEGKTLPVGTVKKILATLKGEKKHEGKT